MCSRKARSKKPRLKYLLLQRASQDRDANRSKATRKELLKLRKLIKKAHHDYRHLLTEDRGSQEIRCHLTGRACTQTRMPTVTVLYKTTMRTRATSVYSRNENCLGFSTQKRSTCLSRRKGPHVGAPSPQCPYRPIYWLCRGPNLTR